jgi:phosphoenolpyruvate---glycerone phosphotransferase subunit DhaL
VIADGRETETLLMITKVQILEWIRTYAVAIAENKAYLTELDAAIGDADHGINMARGFDEVASRLPGLEHEEISTILRTVGMTLLSKVGGASGPLYGTLFMRLSMATAGKQELTDADFLEGLTSGMIGIQQRGSAHVGEKTMVDVLSPAMDAFAAALAVGMPLCDALHASLQAAAEGLHATIAMQATKGRASYLGSRSIGHQDPGATSAYLLVKAAVETLCA